MLELVIAIIGALVGGSFTIAAGFIHKGKKVVSYKINSMPFLRFMPLDSMLIVAVDKSIISNNLADKGTFDQIDSAYGFEITILNTGNEDIEKPNIEIQLDKAAKVISHEIQPASRPGYEIVTQKDPSQPNILRVLIPFINKKEEMLIRVISTGNQNKLCKVDVLGLGIKSRKMNSFSIIYSFVVSIVSLMLISIILFLPDRVLLALGGAYSTTRRVNPPIWVLFIFIFVFMPPIFVIIKLFLEVKKRKENKWTVN